MDKLCLFTTYNENNWCNLSLLWIGTDNKIVPNTEYRVHHWGLGGLCNPAFLLYRYCRHIKVMSNSIIPKAQRKTTSRHILNYLKQDFTEIIMIRYRVKWNSHLVVATFTFGFTVLALSRRLCTLQLSLCCLCWYLTWVRPDHGSICPGVALSQIYSCSIFDGFPLLSSPRMLSSWKL